MKGTAGCPLHADTLQASSKENRSIMGEWTGYLKINKNEFFCQENTGLYKVIEAEERETENTSKERVDKKICLKVDHLVSDQI